jgi:4,5-dihydroxyphthalate decarboxylase
MHAVAVRKSLLEEHQGLAASIFAAYSKAKQMAYRQMAGIGWGADMLPWYGQEMEATIDVMGQNFYSYGLPENRKALETLFRYSHEQGLASRQLKVEELFHPTSLGFTEQAG